jgi:gas vesicle protein
VNKFVRSLLNIGLTALELSDRAASEIRDQVKDRVEDISDRVEDLSDRTRRAVGLEQSHALQYTLSFVAGVGVGIGVGMLLAPASGEETRNTIAEKVQDTGERVRDRFSSSMGATGTETR